MKHHRGPVYSMPVVKGLTSFYSSCFVQSARYCPHPGFSVEIVDFLAEATNGSLVIASTLDRPYPYSTFVHMAQNNTATIDGLSHSLTYDRYQSSDIKYLLPPLWLEKQIIVSSYCDFGFSVGPLAPFAWSTWCALLALAFVVAVVTAVAQSFPSHTSEDDWLAMTKPQFTVNAWFALHFQRSGTMRGTQNTIAASKILLCWSFMVTVLSMYYKKTFYNLASDNYDTQLASHFGTTDRLALTLRQHLYHVYTENKQYHGYAWLARQGILGALLRNRAIALPPQSVFEIMANQTCSMMVGRYESGSALLMQRHPQLFLIRLQDSPSFAVSIPVGGDLLSHAAHLNELSCTIRESGIFNYLLRKYRLGLATPLQEHLEKRHSKLKLNSYRRCIDICLGLNMLVFFWFLLEVYALVPDI